MFNRFASSKNIGIGNVSLPPAGHPITSGAWVWFIDPRGVRYNGKTYFGFIDHDGNVKVASFADGNATDTITTLKAAMEVDDHDNPSILIRDSDKKLLIFYSKHDSTVIYLRISSNAESIAAFAAEVDLASSIGGVKYTYPNPIQLLSEVNDPIYLFYRDRDGSGNSLWAYSKSTDGGATWAARTTLFSQQTSAYMRFCSNGADRIDFAASTHPNEDVDDSKKIYHFYYSGGNYYQTDGTQIAGALPLDGTDVTTVYTTANRCWAWDVARDGSNNLAIVFADFPSSSAHNYYYSRWNGSAWVTNQILATGAGSFSPQTLERYYAGGVVLDPADVNTVYLSKPVNGVFEIWKYTTADNGASWAGAPITTGSSQHNCRPVVIRNAGARNILWWQGIYPSYTTYKTQIRAGTG